jgi:transposase-like protein
MKTLEKAGAGVVRSNTPQNISFPEDVSGLLATNTEVNVTLIKNTLHCPICKSRQFNGIGRQKGVQRFKCKHCYKYFSETTGKFMYYLKKREKLATYIQCVLAGFSIRKCASICGISNHTSFLWRHKILTALQDLGNPGFSQIVESMSLEEPFSNKGQKKS